MYGALPFNDPARSRELIRHAGDALACVVFEPVVEQAPRPEWLAVLREETERAGAVLIADEIKTVGRLALGGGAERYGFQPDLTVMGKAIANGFPLAAVGGSTAVMQGVSRTWISSTLATEYVALAAARATLAVMTAERVPAHLARLGGRLLDGLHTLSLKFPRLVSGVSGIAEMCFLRYADEAASRSVARECARRGLLFKRTAYNFVSLAHDDAVVDWTLGALDEALAAAAQTR